MYPPFLSLPEQEEAEEALLPASRRIRHKKDLLELPSSRTLGKIT